MDQFGKEHSLWNLVADKATPLLPAQEQAGFVAQIDKFKANFANREAQAAIHVAPGVSSSGAISAVAGKEFSSHILTAGKVAAGIVATVAVLNAWDRHREARTKQSWAQRVETERQVASNSLVRQ